MHTLDSQCPREQIGHSQFLDQAEATKRLEVITQSLDVLGDGRGLATTELNVAYSVTINGALLARDLIQNGHDWGNTSDMIRLCLQMGASDRQLFASNTFWRFAEPQRYLPKLQARTTESDDIWSQVLREHEETAAEVYRPVVVTALEEHAEQYEVVRGLPMYGEDAVHSATHVAGILGQIAASNELLWLSRETSTHSDVMSDARIADISHRTAA